MRKERREGETTLTVGAALAAAASLMTGPVSAAPAPGWRDFSGPMDGYGDLVVIDPDDGASDRWL
ncbi:hypothetical protein [Streptomyces sp. NPDC049887]|uniref:hypothetical protein n=1 Tax=Streptomyces sp. NPDC049887 TaxID=3155654 RepID=UPI0034123FF8